MHATACDAAVDRIRVLFGGDFLVTAVDELFHRRAHSPEFFSGHRVRFAACDTCSRRDAGASGFVVGTRVPRRLLRRVETVQQRRKNVRLRHVVSADQTKRSAPRPHVRRFSSNYKRVLNFPLIVTATNGSRVFLNVKVGSF